MTRPPGARVSVALACVGFGLGIAWLAVSATTLEGVPPRASDVPTCSPAFQDTWQRAAESHGVLVAKRSIFGRAGRKFGSLFPRNWYPITASTETFCGRLTRFGWFDGGTRENDLNLFLVPEPEGASARLLEDARDLGWVEPGHLDIEAEVTKPRRLDALTGRRFEYGYFRRPPGQSVGGGNGFYEGSPALALRGALLCTYGPWVTEWQSHAAKPEIHPAELLWWAEGEDRVFVHVQDDSRRFHSARQFTRYNRYGSGRVAGWQPWGRGPLLEDLRIAYEVTSGSHRRVNLGTVPHHADGVVEVDAAARSIARRRIDASTSLTVTESGDPAHLDIAIGTACRVAGADVYRGFLDVRSAVGSDRSGSRGYHLFRLSADGNPPVALPLELRPPDETNTRAARLNEEREVDAGLRILASLAARRGETRQRVASRTQLITLVMQTIPALDDVALVGRFPDEFFERLGLPARRWQPGDGGTVSTPGADATVAMVRYLNLAFFSLEDDELDNDELLALRAALVRVQAALDSVGS